MADSFSDYSNSKENAALQAMAQHARKSEQNIASMAERLPKLVRRLKKFNRFEAVAAVAGLLSLPEFHASTIRLEALAHLVATYAEGTWKPEYSHIRAWASLITEDHITRLEDPIEDVFVGNVISGLGNTAIFEGIWEGNSDFLQGILWALSRCADQDWAKNCIKSVSAMLILSQGIADRNSLSRYHMSESKPWQKLKLPKGVLDKGMNAVVFSVEELVGLGIRKPMLEPFIANQLDQTFLGLQEVGHSQLEYQPLLMEDNRLLVCLPTAISPAIRHYAIKCAKEAGQIHELVTHLTNYQWHYRTLNSMSGWGIKKHTVSAFDEENLIVDSLGEFDHGSYAHVMFVQDKLEEVLDSGFMEIVDTGRRVSARIENIARENSNNDGYRRGLTIIVHGGVGRGQMVGVKELPTDWEMMSLSSEEFANLGFDEKFNCAQMFNLLDQERTLNKQGVRFTNINGALNLYSYAKENDFQMLSPEMPLTGSLAWIGTDYLAPLRQRLRQKPDRHAVPDPSRGGFCEVQRLSIDSFFSEMEEKPIYVRIDAAVSGHLQALIEFGKKEFWIVWDPEDDIVSANKDYIYRLWDMVTNWAYRILQKIDQPILEALPRSLVLKLVINADRTSLENASLDIDTEPQVEIIRSETIDKLIVDDQLIDSFASPINFGERAIVRAIVSRIFENADVEADQSMIDEVVETIVPNKEARFFHVFTAKTPSDLIFASNSPHKPRYVAPELKAWAHIGLSKKVGIEVSSRSELSIDDTKETLNQAVESIWQDIRLELVQFDRKQLIEKCLINHSAIDHDRSTWKRTASALLGIYEDQKDVVNAALEQEARRGSAALGSRVLAEMAVCESPNNGGHTCSNNDFDQLIARIVLLIEIAAQSDFLYHGFMERGVGVNPNGTFDFPDAFLEGVQFPYLSFLGQEKFLRDARNYQSFFQESDSKTKNDGDELSEYLEAFCAEYLVKPSAFFEFAWKLAEENADQTTIRIKKKSELIDLMKTVTGLGRDDCSVAVNTLCLKPRKKWDEANPSGCTTRDWYPWRYDRRLSLTYRPIVELAKEKDPDCILSVPLLDRSLLYRLKSYSGELELPLALFDTEQMKTWYGRTIDRMGHEFNSTVCERMIDFGFSAKHDVNMTALGGDKALGDIDVLAWNKDSGQVFAAECKSLATDRTPGEIAERLREYSPEYSFNDGSRGPTKKHMDRMSYLQNNLAELSKVSKIDQRQIELKSLLVTDHPTAISYLSFVGGFDEVVDIDRLPEVVIG